MAHGPSPRLSPEAARPDVFNCPMLRMVPFDAAALETNAELASGSTRLPAADLGPLFGPAPHAMFTRSGREAIGLALDDIGLKPDDEVLILTTTGSPYVSACVTETIHRRCRSAREPGPRTRALIVIHEFGFPASIPQPVAASGIPIIEDCAYALGSTAADGRALGELGDYVVFSLPKALPVAFGGVLKSRRPLSAPSDLTEQGRGELEAWTAAYLSQAPTMFSRRRDIYELYREGFARLGFAARFQLQPGVVPHSFVVAMPEQAVAERMKPLLQQAGIISSVYYGGGGYFLPNHQEMGPSAVEYVISQFADAYEAARRHV